MEHKHKLELEALVKKCDTLLLELDKVRKVEQANLLQKFMNQRNELSLNQSLETAKFKNTL